MPIPYNSVSTANTFLKMYGAGSGIEHMKLQKLVYCSYGWWLSHVGLEGERLTSDRPQIWRHGPVFPDLYHTFKIFGRKPINEMQSDDPFVDPQAIDAEDLEVRALIKWVWGRYGHLSSFALSDMTHKQGTPWHRVAQENNFSVNYSTEIPDEYIYEEFSLIKSRDQSSAVRAQASQSRSTGASR